MAMRHLALATAAALAVGGASASVNHWGEHDTDTDGIGPDTSFEFASQTVNASGGGGLGSGDMITFTLSGSPLNVLTATALSNHPFSGATVELWADGGVTAIDSFSYAGSKTFAPVGSGDYFYKVLGDFPAMGGSYTYYLASSVAVVPEPETYALMLAGLGALGFIARRRSQG
ncbi:MAG: FxDxF family PEP-CTERM protein [Burkholderiaceae bacterium]|nr:FxDxF family PEP-CTERM protein [Burkholderiaceae bacterium]